MKDWDKWYAYWFPFHRFKWWQLWRWNEQWNCRAYRYKWMRDLVGRLEEKP